MRKDELAAALSRGLARLGWPKAQVRRTVQEVGDHWEDLEEEGRDQGLDATAAADFAHERIGESQTLIRFHHDAMRKAHWAGRYPIISFVLFPPIALTVWFLCWVALAAGATDLYGKLLNLPGQIWGSYLVVLIGAKVIHYTGVLAVPALFCWWARSSFCGLKWGWIACAVCAFHGLLNHVTVRAHSLHWGYGLAVPDWLPVLAPLIVAGIAYWFARPNPWRASAALVVVALTCGCTTSKAPQQRGWIGGEYKQVKAADGLLVTALTTNTPAAQSGLKEGDLIVRLAGKSVDNLKAFRKSIDTADTGTMLPISVLRDGVTFDAHVVVGREVLKPSHAITVGLLLSREWDLWPNPDFSLIALGYKRQHKRLELNSPEARLKLAARQESDEQIGGALRSPEGWEIWLPVCSFSARKRILSQSASE